MMTEWVWKKFSELSTNELYEIMRLRQQVFQIEQKMNSVDADLKDINSFHLFFTGQIKSQNKIFSYLRVLAPHNNNIYPILGRILVRKEFRKQGHGKILIKRALKQISKKWPNIPVEVHAQEHLKELYEGLGFKMISEPFLEEGISHLRMLALIEP